MTPSVRLQRCKHGFDATVASNRPVMSPSGFDLVSSFLLAVLVMLATLVMILLTLWLLAFRTAGADRLPPPRMLSGSLSPALPERDFEVPADVEVTDLASPTLANLVAEVDSLSRQVDGADQLGNGARPGTDQGLLAGTGLDDHGVVPASQRWELSFVAPHQAAYARQLDWHGMELGVFGGGFTGLDYASGLSTSPLARHSRDASGESRLYFSWVRRNPLAAYERGLLVEAGIPTKGRQIVKFVPAELEIRLSEIELEYAHSNGVTSRRAIGKTVFRSEPDGAGYRFIVVSQRYKRGARRWSSEPQKTNLSQYMMAFTAQNHRLGP